MNDYRLKAVLGAARFERPACMTHVASRTWMPDDIRRLREMSEGGISAVRAAVVLRRSIVSVKAKAKILGSPFPDDRLLKRQRRAQEAQAESGKRTPQLPRNDRYE